MDARARLDRFARRVQPIGRVVDLDRVVLSLGEWEQPLGDEGDDAGLLADEAREAQGLRRLDELADRAQRRLVTDSAPWAGARAVVHTLFAEGGFVGDTETYDDPRNSFLHDVLARGRGLPITLSVLFLEVARRVGVNASGVGLPGHFVVRVEADPIDGETGHALVLDPFRGGQALGPAEVLALVRSHAGDDARLTAQTLAPVDGAHIVGRMLRNLAGAYARRRDLWRSLEVLERLAVLDPDNARLADDLDALRARAADLN